MESVRGRKIVLGISGGIAAYKAIELMRRLVDAGAHVAPIMTADAHRFIGPVTVSALASEPLHTSLWDDPSPIPHTRLGQGADLIVVAPATARVLAAYAAGLSDDLLVATLIATRAPVVVCPAMHTEMWEHPSVVDNIATLRSRGVVVVDPESGRLAGGDVGAGRLAETDTILAAISDTLENTGKNTGAMSGWNVVVSAGGTREPIDAVRVIANRSSGKQGHAIAAAAHARGARVTLVTTSDLPVETGVSVVRVETAQQMMDAMVELAPQADAVVMSAAVADFRPVAVVGNKIKKESGVPTIELEPTPDILAHLGSTKPSGQVLVGFAAETDDLVENAMSKLRRKNLDVVVANDVSAPGVGFNHDTNAVTILTASGDAREVGLADKRTIATAILDSVVEMRSRAESRK